MALRHRFTLLCEHVITDTTGKDSYIGSFVNLALDKLPGSISAFYVVVGFTGEPGDRFSVSLVGPDRKVLAVLKEATIPDYDSSRVNAVTYGILHFPLLNFEFSQAGVHEVVLRQDRKVVHRQPFGIVKKSKRG